MFYAFIIGIILLNIIIAVLSAAYENIKDNSDRAFWSTRYSIIAKDTNSMLRILNFLPKKFNCVVSACQLHSDKILRGLFTSTEPNYRQSLLQIKPKRQTVHDIENFSADEINQGQSQPRDYRQGEQQKQADHGRDHFSNDGCGSRRLFFIKFTTCLYAILIFIAGILTFRLLWPDVMKEFLFSGKTEETRKENITKALQAENGKLNRKFAKLTEMVIKLRKDNLELKDKSNARVNELTEMMLEFKNENNTKVEKLIDMMEIVVKSKVQIK